MKIAEAKKIYSSQLDTLWKRKRELTKMLKADAANEVDGLKYDKVELSQELSQVEKQYNQTQALMERIYQKETGVHNAAVAKQQGETISQAMDDMAKCLEIARRISSGGKVPPADEKKLMEYSHELYMAAKNMAMTSAQKKEKKYDSLLEEEEGKAGDERSASEIADNAEIAVEGAGVASEGTSSESE